MASDAMQSSDDMADDAAEKVEAAASEKAAALMP